MRPEATPAIKLTAARSRSPLPSPRGGCTSGKSRFPRQPNLCATRSWRQLPLIHVPDRRLTAEGLQSRCSGKYMHMCTVEFAAFKLFPSLLSPCIATTLKFRTVNGQLPPPIANQTNGQLLPPICQWQTTPTMVSRSDEPPQRRPGETSHEERAPLKRLAPMLLSWQVC